MMQWLQNYTGLKTYGENIEISELNSLKKQLKYYKKKYGKKEKENNEIIFEYHDTNIYNVSNGDETTINSLPTVSLTIF